MESVFDALSRSQSERELLEIREEPCVKRLSENQAGRKRRKTKSPQSAAADGILHG